MTAVLINQNDRVQFMGFKTHLVQYDLTLLWLKGNILKNRVKISLPKLVYNVVTEGAFPVKNDNFFFHFFVCLPFLDG